MDIIKQNRKLKIAVTVLIVMNIITIALLWIGRPTGPGPGGMPLSPEEEKEKVSALLKDKLGFNQEQIERYLNLRAEHYKAASDLNREVQLLKKEMFDRVLENEKDVSSPDSLLNLILLKQADIEKLTYNHFLKLKELCGKEQKEKLKILMHQMFHPQLPPPDQNPAEGKGVPPRP
ncbi:MAG: hypothetical protein D6830_07420 [Ignavibacteria bacterium]|nr:MAG: hypothetical protein D6830_07420 [Ignavibacteria bacterium]